MHQALSTGVVILGRAGAAAERARQVDGAREQYVCRLYHWSVDDPALYHLEIDSTILSADACAELIVTAYRALVPG